MKSLLIRLKFRLIEAIVVNLHIPIELIVCLEPLEGSKYIRPPNSIVLARPLDLSRVRRASLRRSFQNDTRPVYRPGQSTAKLTGIDWKVYGLPLQSPLPMG